MIQNPIQGISKDIEAVEQEVPFHLQYRLNRLQRLIPHLCVWGPYSFFLPICLVGIAMFAIDKPLWWTLVLFAVVAGFRGFFIGLLDVILHPVRDMDILIDEKGLGFLAGGKRWWLFLDGIINIAKYRKDVWTIQHFNGSVVNIPTSVITQDQIAHLRKAMEHGRTPEGIQEVIERGRRLQELEKKKSSTEVGGKEE